MIKREIKKPMQAVIISKLIGSCREEQYMDRKIEILYRINSILPKLQKLKIPSLLTDDYVEVALYEIETTIPFI